MYLITIFLFSSTHENYFRTAINIFNDHIFLEQDQNLLENFVKKTCMELIDGALYPTHIIITSLLAEVGLIGFGFLLVGYILFIYVLFKIIKEKKLDPIQKLYIVLLGH